MFNLTTHVAGLFYPNFLEIRFLLGDKDPLLMIIVKAVTNILLIAPDQGPKVFVTIHFEIHTNQKVTHDLITILNIS